MKFTLSKETHLRALTRETAKMSFPGRMQKIVGKDSKKEIIEKYFVESSQMEGVLIRASEIAIDYEKWHSDRVDELSKLLEERITNKEYNSKAVAAKLLDTYMFQLMKYKQCRPLWNELYLVIDSRVLNKLKQYAKNYGTLKVVENTSDSAYSISYKKYKEIQDALVDFITEINNQDDVHPKLESRIELNSLLWAGANKIKNYSK